MVWGREAWAQSGESSEIHPGGGGRPQGDPDPLRAKFVALYSRRREDGRAGEGELRASGGARVAVRDVTARGVFPKNGFQVPFNSHVLNFYYSVT